MNVKIGLDFGGVIVKLNEPKPQEDTSLDGSDFLDIAHDGMLEGVKTLISRADGAVWIVSKAGPKMQKTTRDWLDAIDFYTRTGMNRAHLQFCLERPQKAEICKSLQLTHFVDDRLHIMQILRYCVPNLFLFGPEERRKFTPPWAHFVTSWPDLVTRMLMLPD